MRKIDVTGQRFDRLTAVKPIGSVGGRVHWLFRCDCGGTIERQPSVVRSGNTGSCGCKKRDADRNRGTHKGSGSRLYRIWHTMKRRCYDESFAPYPWYGAKGIGVCDEWRENFEAFREWTLANGYEDRPHRPRKEHLTLDRRRAFEDYSPNNCQWLTHSENSKERWNRVFAEY